MKIPRNISGERLQNALENLGYRVTRQKGSHIRLTKTILDGEHHITIPKHSAVKIGTLNNILNDVAKNLMIDKSDLINKLFKS